MEKDYDKTLKSNYDLYLKEQSEKKSKKKNELIRYKEELDKQILGNKILKMSPSSSKNLRDLEL
jgi:hypothetical protein